MKYFLKIAGVFFIILSAGMVKAQQNIQMTQYIFNSLSVNPAYAGYKEEWFAQVGLRSQWVGLEGAPKTGSISIDGVTNQTNKKHGVGLQLKADGLGAQSATSIFANYAFRLRLNEEDTQRLSFGLGAGVTQYSLDGNKLDPIHVDPTLPTGRVSEFVPDIRLGVYYNTSKFYFGVSVNDILADQDSELSVYDPTTTKYLRRKTHAYIMSGFLFNLDDGLKLRPSLLWKEDFKGPSSLDLNASLIFDDKLWVGAAWRTGVNFLDKEYPKHSPESLGLKNAFAGIVQFYVSKSFRVGYSYDYIISDLSSYQNGSHEITLGLTFGKKQTRVLSPRFF